MIFREGHRGTRDQSADGDITEAVVQSIREHVCEPLARLCYHVTVYVDLVCPNARVDEAKDESYNFVFLACGVFMRLGRLFHV